MAKDKLIFIIICSAAIGVAVITMASFLFPRSSRARGVRQWQCLNCDDIFKKKTLEWPPIECPKCSGQAVGFSYRTCPQCGEEIVVSRWRLTEAGKAQEKARKAQEEAKGFRGPPQGPFGPMGMGPPIETQYRAQQNDGSYGWTDWISSRTPAAVMIYSTLKCEKCQALLYPSRSGRSSHGDR